MKNFVGGVLILIVMLVSVFFTAANAQTLQLDCRVVNNISAETQVIVENKTEGDIQLYYPKSNKIKPSLDMGYLYEVVFMSEGCATKILEFDLRTTDTPMNGAKFMFEVVMIPASEPEQVIRAGVITYVESSKELSYIIQR